MHGPMPGKDHEARLEYRDGAFRVVVPGGFVTCAVTARRVPLDSLRYWSVERQEAYADAAAALEGFRRPR